MQPLKELSLARQRLIRRLGDRRGRVREGLVLVEGWRGTETARAGGATIRFAVLAGDSASPDEVALAEALVRDGVEVMEASRDVLAEIADTETPQGILAVVAEPRPELPDRAAASVLVLDGIQDPGNAGTLIRTAAAFGVERVLALDGTVDPWSPKVVRASAGAVFLLPVHRLRVQEALAWLRTVRIPLLAADANGEDVRRVSVGAPVALLLGNEGAGPRPEALAAAAQVVALPMVAGAESLNVAVAGSILLWTLGPGAQAP